MSTREQAEYILKTLSDEQIAAFVTLFGSEIPNIQTVEAMQELENGVGTVFTGTTDDLFSKLAED